jgi:hypothetical protein
MLRLSKNEERRVVQAKSAHTETGRSPGKKRKRSPNSDAGSVFGTPSKAGPSRLRLQQPRSGDAATPDHGPETFNEEDSFNDDGMPTSDSREQEPDRGKHIPLCFLCVTLA